MMEKFVLSAKDVQAMLGISRRKTYDLLNQKGFPTLRVGRRILVPADAFNRWIAEQTAV